MQKSLKDQGNDCYKKQRFQEAIECYKQYVQKQHSDNNMAQVNIGLCYFQLKQYEAAIQAYNCALEINQTYPKTYYRLMNEHKLLQQEQPQKDHNYNIFINAARYLHYQDNKNASEYKEVRNVFETYREKIKKNEEERKGKRTEQAATIIQTNKEQLSEEQQQIQVDKLVEEWQEEWKDNTQSEQAKWCQVQYMAKEVNSQFGINLAYLLLNHTTKQQQKQQIKSRIKKLKQELKSGKSKSPNSSDSSDQSEKKINSYTIQEQTVESKEVNILTQYKEQQTTPQIPQNSHQKIMDFLNKKQEKINTQEDPSPEHLQTTISTQKKKPKADHINSPKQTLPASITTQQNQTFEDLYAQYTVALKEKDIFNGTLKAIMKILQSKKDTETKRCLLVQLKKRIKKMNLIVKSFSANQQRLIADLLARSGLQELCIDFIPTFKQ